MSGEPKRKGPLAWMAENKVAANVVMLVLLVGGVAMFSRVRQEVFPEVDLDTVIINIPYPGASPEEVEQGVILAVEEAVRGLDGIKEVRSTATEGMAVVALELELGTNSDRALADVKSAVDRVTSFPEDAERPVIAMATNRRQVISMVLYGDVPEAVLKEIAEQERQDLLSDDRITYVDFSGVRPLEVSIQIPQERLREHGLTHQMVADRIRAASVEVPGGGVKTRAGEVLLRTAERRDRGDEFADIVLLSRPDGSEVRVRDVADVTDGFREVDQEAFFDGKRAVMINVYRTGDQTPIDVSDAVHEHMDKLGERLPAGVHAATWFDSSEMYRERVDLLSHNAMIGLVLVLLTLGLFLEPKLAFWVTLGIPISFAGTLLFLPATDVSINMISLFAFIVTLGMVVDDAIVVGEAVYSYREQGLAPLEAAVKGVREVAVPVVFSILTTCIAFAPMLFVPGVMGKFFRVIPIVVITVLLISLVESQLILPAHLAHKMPWWLRGLLFPLLFVMGLLTRLRINHLLPRFVERVHQPILRVLLRWRWTTLFVCVAVAMGSCGSVAGGRIQFSFMPKIDSDVVTASLAMPVGTPVEETRVVAERIEQDLVQILEEHGGRAAVSRGIFTEIGSGASSLGGHGDSGRGSGSHLASVRVYLVPTDHRPFTATELANIWRRRVGEVAGAESLTYQFSVGASGGSPVDIRLSHEDPEVLHAAAARLAGELRSYNGLTDIDNGYSEGKEQLDFHLLPAARALGLTEGMLARQVRSAFFGAEAVRQQRGRDEVRVYVRLPESERRSLHDIERFVVRAPDGGEIPVAEAAEIDHGHAYMEIKRTDGRRTVDVTADVIEGQANENQVIARLKREELPRLLADVPGLTYKLAGRQQEQAEALGSLFEGFGMALIVMLALLAIVFRSYIQPFIVMSAIPFGFVGALGGHYLMGYDLSIMSMFGVVALSGVVVNDSLIMVDAINRYRKEHDSLFEAVTVGAMRRFRPILLTSLTTFFGLVPMIVETSVQARFLIPMAISLGFGVLFATAITMVLVPALYLIVEDIKKAVAFIIGLYRRPRPAPSEPLPGE